MKLYYSPGACSLSPHIVASEAGIPLELEQIDLSKRSPVTASGADYTTISPNGYVPALELDDGSVLTEGPAIVQYLADMKPSAGLAPAAGSPDHYRLQSWLNFVSSELHKTYSWLFNVEAGPKAHDIARKRLADRLAYIDRHLARSGPFLMGARFTVADAYLFTVVGWSEHTKVDLSGFTQLRAYMDRVGRRPKVREAMQAEGLTIAA